MATPPQRRLLSTSDVPGAPDWLERLLIPLNKVLVPMSAALAQGLTFGENFAGEVREVTLTAPDDWIPLAPYLTNSWQVNTTSDRPAAAIRKSLDGSVMLRGTLKRTGAPASGSNVFTWPSGYAPEGRQTFGFATDTGLGAAEATSTAYLYYAGGTATYPLDEIRFTAADRTPPRWATPVDVKLGQPQRPFQGKAGQVVVLGARQASDVTLPAVVSGIDWVPFNLEKQKSAPGVRIHRVWGLTPGVQYRLTLLVLPE